MRSTCSMARSKRMSLQQIGSLIQEVGGSSRLDLEPARYLEISHRGQTGEADFCRKPWEGSG
jgi:hypothetical protein